jgi:hypothetical protein
MGSSQSFVERRSSARPRNGDVQRCPHCAKGVIEFNGQFRQNGEIRPAWICDNASCSRKEVPVRKDAVDPPSSNTLMHTSRMNRAEAALGIMKAKARVARTARRGQKREAS